MPAFVNGTPKPRLAGSGFTNQLRLSVQWKCATPGARWLSVQRSEDNGVSDPWTEVFASADTSAGEWISATPDDAALDAYYRLDAQTAAGASLAMSAATHYIPKS